MQDNNPNNNSVNTFESNIQTSFDTGESTQNMNQPNGEVKVVENQNISIRERGKMRVRRKRRFILAIILIVILLVGGYFLYDLYLKDLFNREEVEEVLEDIDISNIKVINAYTGDSNLISIPKIDVDTKVATKMNLKMMSDSYKNVDYWRKNFVDKANKSSKSKEDFEDFYECYKNISHEYKVYKNKGILIIHIYVDSLSTINYMCMENNNFNYDSPDYYYFYDVKNDKELDFYEAVEYLNIEIKSAYSYDTSCKTVADLKKYKGKISVESNDIGDMSIVCN